MNVPLKCGEISLCTKMISHMGMDTWGLMPGGGGRRGKKVKMSLASGSLLGFLLWSVWLLASLISRSCFEELI